MGKHQIGTHRNDTDGIGAVTASAGISIIITFTFPSTQDVLLTINELLHVTPSFAEQRWTAELIHDKNLLAILRLLVALSKQFNRNAHLRPGVFLSVIKTAKLNAQLKYTYIREYITDAVGIEPSTF